MTEPPDALPVPAGPRADPLFWLRVALGVVGLFALVWLVHRVGARNVALTLRPALRWLPALLALELCRVGCEVLASTLAYGDEAKRIPRAVLFRACLVGHTLSAFAPAPRVVHETLKVTLLAPYVGAPAATSVGFVGQAATLLAVGLFSLPCGAAIYVLSGPSLWFWAQLVHAAVLVGSGLGLRALTRAQGPGAWLARKFPRLARGHGAFREHNARVGLWAAGPTLALLGNRCFQATEYAVAARAVGIDADLLHALSAQGVSMVAAAVGVLVPGGLGTTDGAFAAAAELLGTTALRTTSLALLLRSMQLVWMLLGALVLLAMPRAKVRP